jgi:hypothetical protein
MNETSIPAQEDIEREAFRLWKESGEPTGRDQEFWFQAEQNLRARKPSSEDVITPMPPASEQAKAQRKLRNRRAA